MESGPAGELQIRGGFVIRGIARGLSRAALITLLCLCRFFDISSVDPDPAGAYFFMSGLHSLVCLEEFRCCSADQSERAQVLSLEDLCGVYFLFVAAGEQAVYRREIRANLYCSCSRFRMKMTGVATTRSLRTAVKARTRTSLWRRAESRSRNVTGR